MVDFSVLMFRLKASAMMFVLTVEVSDGEMTATLL